MALTAALPTLYEYYTAPNITTGLSVDQSYFTLNNKNITLYSGAMHYFRIPRQYWRDRLRKLRASGCNTVETYVPWNLHEPRNGTFDFGHGGSDMEDFLDLEEFLKIAKEEDLLAIVRPGPYICSEFEWGGLPSWLLRDDDIKVRTSEPKYLSYVQRYFSVLLPVLAALQFINGGPIIAVQVENEYGSSPIIDRPYIEQLRLMLLDGGIGELLVTSDGAWNSNNGTLPGVLFQTVNFGSDPEASFKLLEDMQPGKPVMAMEFWAGWFDHWGETHNGMDALIFWDLYERILVYPASVNLYMFHGGTNWGFLNGANINDWDYVGISYQPTTTSYDYDAPLTESGDYTVKYEILRELIKKYNTIETVLPEPPQLVTRQVYPVLPIEGWLSLNQIIEQAPHKILSENLTPMEKLDINNNSGQSYGYTVYRKENIDIRADSVLEIQGYVPGTVMVLINGVLITQPLKTFDDFNNFGYWKLENSNMTINNGFNNATLDFIVENWGRVNFGYLYYQSRGLGDNNTILIANNEVTSWQIYPLEFPKTWTSGLKGWSADIGTGPGLFRATFTIEGDPRDTYVDMRGWGKGVVIVNSFVLGRYASMLGPQQTLYLPGPFLNSGINEIIIFEQFEPGRQVQFVKDAVYDTPKSP